MSHTIEARCSGGAIELSLPEAVDAVQRLAGPGPRSVDIAGTLVAGGSVEVGGWRFEGRDDEPALVLADAGASKLSALFPLGIALTVLSIVAPALVNAAETLRGVQ